ncbi:hypothetical protein D3C86_1685700 [compost metagenome]
MQVVGVLAGDVDAVLFDEVLQCRQVPRHVLGQIRRLLKLRGENALGELATLHGIVVEQQLFVDLLHAASAGNRVFVGRLGFKSCQGSHGAISRSEASGRTLDQYVSTSAERPRRRKIPSAFKEPGQTAAGAALGLHWSEYTQRVWTHPSESNHAHGSCHRGG